MIEKERIFVWDNDKVGSYARMIDNFKNNSGDI